MNDQTQSYNLNTTYKVIAVLALVLAIVMGLVAYQKNSARMASAAESRIRDGNDTSTMTTSAVGSTTPTGVPTAFLVTGQATSTLTFASDNFNALSVEMLWIGTSTIRDTLAINLYTSSNNVDFYPYDVSWLNQTNKPSDISVSSTSPALLWSPASTNATTTKSLKLPFIPSKYTRAVFSLGTTTPITKVDQIGFYANAVGQIDGTR